MDEEDAARSKRMRAVKSEEERAAGPAQDPEDDGREGTRQGTGKMNVGI